MLLQKKSLGILLGIFLASITSCKTLEERLHDVERFCVYKPSVSDKAICYKFRYWAKGGEVLSDEMEIDLPETIYFVDGDDLARLFEDRDRAARFRETHTCRVKRRR